MAFTGKDPKDTYLALLNLGDANEVLQAVTTTTVLDAAGNSSIFALSQNTIEFINILTATVAGGVVLDSGIAFEADDVSVDSVLNKSDNTVGVYFTSGDPEGSLTAGVGSLALRDDGVAGATLFIKESGTGNTGWVAVDVVDTFLGLTDTPGTYTADKWVKVNSGGTALELADTPIGAFTDLSDTPASLTAGKWLKVNSGGTALELTDDPTAAATTFINLPDTPSSYVADKWLQVNGGGTALAFVDAPPVALSDLTDADITTPAQGELLFYDGSNWANLGVGLSGYVLSSQGAGADPVWVSLSSSYTFLGLVDTPGTYTADKWLKVDATGNFLEWTDATLTILSDTNISAPAQGELFFYDGIQWTNLSVGVSGYFLSTQGPGANPSWIQVAFDALSDTDLTTPAQGDVIYFDGSNWVNLAPSTDGYVLTTHGAAANPTWADAGAVATFSGLSDTDITTPAQGDILYFDGSNWVNMVAGTSGEVLLTQGAAADPIWGKTTFADLDDANVAGPAQGDVLYFDGSDWVNLSVGTNGYMLTTHGAGAAPTWSDPASGGTLAGLGDTNITSPAQGGILFFDGSDWVDMSVGTAGYVLSTQGVGANPQWVDRSTFDALSDTNLTTPAQGDVLYFDGTDWVNLVAGTDGHFLTTHGAGSDPTWSSASAGSTFEGLSDTNLTTPAQGDVLYFDGSDWVNLAPGTDGYVLTTHGASSDPTWSDAGGGASTFIGLSDTPVGYGNQYDLIYMDTASTIGYQTFTSFLWGNIYNPFPDAGEVIRYLGGEIGWYPMTFSTMDDVSLTTPAQGDILYYDGTDFVNLAPSTDGYVLTTHGASANPTWAVAGSGSWLPLTGGTLTGALAISVASGSADFTLQNDGSPNGTWKLSSNGETGLFELFSSAVRIIASTTGANTDSIYIQNDRMEFNADFVVVPNGIAVCGYASDDTTPIEFAYIDTSDYIVTGNTTDCAGVKFECTNVPSWNDGGGAVDLATVDDLTFTNLSETPSSFTSSDNDKIVKVNSSYNAVEFGPRILVGTGSPQSSVTGSPGDLYVDTTGGTAAVLYVKASGSETTTGWDLVTSADAT